jgi:beta-glucosidase
MTFVRATGQIPLYYNVSLSGRRVMGYYGETDIYNRNYEDCLGTPMYPFGYGLSYTTFAYSDLKTNRKTISLAELENGETVDISVTITNTGDRAGKEVAQCYVRDCICDLTRPMKELKGFEKPMIEAGESKTVTFRLGKEAFAYYNGKAEYVVDPGKFVITVGTNCLCTDAVEIFVEK